jgi:hypothetical protein
VRNITDLSSNSLFLIDNVPVEKDSEEEITIKDILIGDKVYV